MPMHYQVEMSVTNEKIGVICSSRSAMIFLSGGDGMCHMKTAFDCQAEGEGNETTCTVTLFANHLHTHTPTYVLCIKILS